MATTTATDSEILSAADIKVLQHAREFEQLIRMPGWKLVLDWLKFRADEALIAHRENLSNDALVILSFKQRWQERDQAVMALERHVYNVIARKVQLVQDLLHSGVTVEQLEAALQPLEPNITGPRKV